MPASSCSATGIAAGSCPSPPDSERAACSHCGRSSTGSGRSTSERRGTPPRRPSRCGRSRSHVDRAAAPGRPGTDHRSADCACSGRGCVGHARLLGGARRRRVARTRGGQRGQVRTFRTAALRGRAAARPDDRMRGHQTGAYAGVRAGFRRGPALGAAARAALADPADRSVRGHSHCQCVRPRSVHHHRGSADRSARAGPADHVPPGPGRLRPGVARCPPDPAGGARRRGRPWAPLAGHPGLGGAGTGDH